MAGKNVIVLLAEGAEEIEMVISADVLRRAGANVVIAGIDGKGPVKCSRDVVVVPDQSLSDVVDNSFDAVVLPGGGPGAERLGKSDLVGKILKSQESAGRLIGAICAAPATSLLPHGIGVGKKMTAYPCFAQKVNEKATYMDETVVEDGMLVTSKGPATAFLFALKLVEKLYGESVAAKLKSDLLV